MTLEQESLFDKQSLRGQRPQQYSITPPAATMTVHQTLPAYHAYLSSGQYSKYTPDDFTGDLKRFGQYTTGKPLHAIQTVDLQQYIAELKVGMRAKTVSRKISALGNYFRWLERAAVLKPNPAKPIAAPRVTAPLPDILFDSECEALLRTASRDPRTYLLVLLLLETGLKKAELLALQTGNFDFSNTYQPELWVKHSGRQAYKDRTLKLPAQIASVYTDYTGRYGIAGTLFPYTPRFIEQLLSAVASDATISKKVTPGILRDMFVVRSVRRGMRLEDAFEKIGIAKSSYDDARKKYGRLTQTAL